jgi:pimeloyl-ACP methyl ester carboxylesterase
MTGKEAVRMPVAKIDDTLDMYYEIDDYTDPWKTPETVVLQHGNTRSSQFWYAWVPHLARQYKVVRPDYRGMGRSTVPPPGYQPSFSGLALDLKTLLDQLGLDQVHLVAEATGGAISMQFAYEYPERLKSLILCGSLAANAAAVGSTLTKWADEEEKSGTEAYVRDLMRIRLDISKADPDMVEWYAQEMFKTPTSSDILFRRLNSVTNLNNILPEIKTPTLIMVGELTAFGLDQYREMNRLIPDSELQVFHGAQHHIAHMYPDECAEAVLAFLRRLSL